MAFFCVCLCVSVDVCLLAHIPQIVRGQRGELDRDYSVSTAYSCHSQRDTSCAVRVKKRRTHEGMHMRARGDDERC